MARIKAEVREHAHQLRLARQHLHAHAPPSATPAPEPSPLVVKAEMMAEAPAPPPPPPVAPESVSGGCIDLTMDDETEDEEDADEPFAAAMQRIREEEAEQERKEQQEAHIEDAAMNVEVPGVRPVDDEETDESEVDEEMPLPTARQIEQEGKTESGDDKPVEVDVEGDAQALLPDDTSTSETKPVQQDVGERETDTPQVDVEDEDNDEEEEDERWPDLRPLKSKNDESGDEDMDSTGSEGGDGSADSTPAAPRITSLEDGEIFEEGAVAKSPTAVKEAIAIELEAARAAATSKKKQKKRGRKKNKRKVEMIFGEQEELDEFGRNVRHQSMPFAHGQPPHAGPVAGNAPGHALPLLPLPPLMTTPPHPPPMPHPPPLPPHDFGHPHGPHQFTDVQFVRVNRHGGFEPFTLHANRGPRLAVAPPFVQPPQMGAPGFRYVRLDHFDSPNRGPMRPPSPKKAPSAEEVRETFHLDSLRAAALKTKRKSAKENDAEITQPPDAVEGETPVKMTTELPVAANENEEVEDLDALRMELLKSMRRKRREPSNQSSASATDSPKDASPSKGSESSSSDMDLSPPSSQKNPERETPATSEKPSIAVDVSTMKQPVVPESPQFRPLTALSQSIVIRLSLDDLVTDQTKVRADSLDDVHAHIEKAVDNIRTEVPTAKTISINGSSISLRGEEAPAKSDSQQTTTKKPVTVVDGHASSFEAENAATGDGSSATSADKAEPAISIPAEEPPASTVPLSTVHDQQVGATHGMTVNAEIAADPVRLEAERTACLTSMREADAHITRLEAEIAALRAAIAAREAETPTGSVSATACGA